MKSPLRKFRVLSGRKSESRDKRSPHKPSQIDELAQANQDMEDMKKCYESLFDAAAATANTTYEFSESLRELGSCLLEKTALNDDEDSGKVLLMLGKAQYQIQKFADSYRSHISKTITRPSESLLAELRTVEDMKNQCDAKRSAYEYMLTCQGEGGKSKSARENVSPQKLQAALDDYEDEANLFIFRLKSLKQGQSRTFLTQAARHHAAQMNFFKKSFHCLELLEPHVKVVTEQQQIDYQFSGLEDDDTEYLDEDGSDVNADGELSSEDEQHMADTLISTRHSMELDHADQTLAPSVLCVTTQGEQGKIQRAVNAVTGKPRNGSHSAPILAARQAKINAPNLREMKALPSRKFNTYVLPTPGSAKTPMPADSSRGPGRGVSINVQTNTLFHSVPLAPKAETDNYTADRSSGSPHLSKSQSVLKESNVNSVTSRASVHLGEGISLHNYDWRASSDTKKLKRHAFSAPLRSKPLSSTPAPSAGGTTTASVEHAASFARMFSGVPVVESVASPRVSSSSSPVITSSPRISELHELPRPPNFRTRKDVYSKTSLVAHSAPLVSRTRQRSPAEVYPTRPTQTTSPLPRPPGPTPRSFSIPSRGSHRTQSTGGPEPLAVRLSEEVASPPLSPIVFPSTQSTVATAEPIAKTTVPEQLNRST